MKKLLFTLLLLAGCFSVQAQQNFNNNTACAVVITPVCYNVNTCSYTPCGPATPVAGNSSVPLANLACSCASNEKRGFMICCAATPSVCRYVSTPVAPFPCALFQPTSSFPACDTCSGSFLSWSAGPNLNLL